MGAKVAKPLENTKSEAKPPPHNYTTILNGRDTKPAIDTSSNSFNDNICQQLRSGVFFKGKEIHKDKLVMKYWIDENRSNCFMVFARSLSITWVNDTRYWRWGSIQEPPGSDVQIDVAELLDVCWLEANGGIDTAWLTPGVKYEVAFVVMFKDTSYGWESQVTLGFKLPTEPKIEQKFNFMEKAREKWMDLTVGTFTSSQQQGNTAAEMKFYLIGYHGGNWKKGLVIKGVVIRPTNQ